MRRNTVYGGQQAEASRRETDDWLQRWIFKLRLPPASRHGTARCWHRATLPLALIGAEMIEAVQEQVATKSRVAAKQLVGAFAGQNDLVTDSAHMTAHEQLGNGEGVVDGSLGIPQGLDKEIVEVIRLNAQHLLMSTDGFSHLRGDRSVVIVLCIKADRKGQQRSLPRFSGTRHISADSGADVHSSTGTSASRRKVTASMKRSRMHQYTLLIKRFRRIRPCGKAYPNSLRSICTCLAAAAPEIVARARPDGCL